MSAKLIEQLRELPHKLHILEQGNHLFHQKDKVSAIFLVEEGGIELTRALKDGRTLVLQRATDNMILAEASLYSDHYHCGAIAIMPSKIRRFSKQRLIKQLQQKPLIANLWAEHLAREVQSVRFRCEILSRKSVAERLDGWLTWHEEQLPEKGHWKSVALQIGCSPEALYRELAKRRKK